MATLWGQKRRRYGLEKYGVCQHHRGWWVGRLEDVDGQLLFKPRQKVKKERFNFDITAGHHLPNGDWVQADVDEYLIAEPRWIVEYKLHDREKVFHERERWDVERDRHVERREVWDKEKQCFVMRDFVYDYENPHTRVDALGEYPKDGKWARLFVIAQHWVKCCEDANERHELCQGIGRPPNKHDIEAIRAILRERELAAKLPEPGTADWAHQMEEEKRKINNEIAENRERAAKVYDEIFDRAIMPELRRVYRRNNPDKKPSVGIHVPDYLKKGAS